MPLTTIIGLGWECNRSSYNQTKEKDLHSILKGGKKTRTRKYMALTDTGGHVAITKDIGLG